MSPAAATLLTAYGTSLAGFAGGLVRFRARSRGYLVAPLMAVPVTAAALIAWEIVLAVCSLDRLSQFVFIPLFVIFMLLFGFLAAGFLSWRRGGQGVTFTRGTIVHHEDSKLRRSQRSDARRPSRARG
jgi:hypothetical protein